MKVYLIALANDLLFRSMPLKSNEESSSDLITMIFQTLNKIKVEHDGIQCEWNKQEETKGTMRFSPEKDQVLLSIISSLYSRISALLRLLAHFPASVIQKSKDVYRYMFSSSELSADYTWIAASPLLWFWGGNEFSSLLMANLPQSEIGELSELMASSSALRKTTSPYISLDSVSESASSSSSFSSSTSRTKLLKEKSNIIEQKTLNESSSNSILFVLTSSHIGEEAIQRFYDVSRALMKSQEIVMHGWRVDTCFSEIINHSEKSVQNAQKSDDLQMKGENQKQIDDLEKSSMEEGSLEEDEEKGKFRKMLKDSLVYLSNLDMRTVISYLQNLLFLNSYLSRLPSKTEQKPVLFPEADQLQPPFAPLVSLITPPMLSSLVSSFVAVIVRLAVSRLHRLAYMALLNDLIARDRRGERDSSFDRSFSSSFRERRYPFSSGIAEWIPSNSLSLASPICDTSEFSSSAPWPSSSSSSSSSSASSSLSSSSSEQTKNQRKLTSMEQMVISPTAKFSLSALTTKLSESFQASSSFSALVSLLSSADPQLYTTSLQTLTDIRTQKLRLWHLASPRPSDKNSSLEHTQNISQRTAEENIASEFYPAFAVPLPIYQLIGRIVLEPSVVFEVLHLFTRNESSFASDTTATTSSSSSSLQLQSQPSALSFSLIISSLFAVNAAIPSILLSSVFTTFQLYVLDSKTSTIFSKALIPYFPHDAPASLFRLRFHRSYSIRKLFSQLLKGEKEGEKQNSSTLRSFLNGTVVDEGKRRILKKEPTIGDKEPIELLKEVIEGGITDDEKRTILSWFELLSIVSDRNDGDKSMRWCIKPTLDVLLSFLPFLTNSRKSVQYLANFILSLILFHPRCFTSQTSVLSPSEYPSQWIVPWLQRNNPSEEKDDDEEESDSEHDPKGQKRTLLQNSSESKYRIKYLLSSSFPRDAINILKGNVDSSEINNSEEFANPSLLISTQPIDSNLTLFELPKPNDIQIASFEKSDQNNEKSITQSFQSFQDIFSSLLLSFPISRSRSIHLSTSSFFPGIESSEASEELLIIPCSISYSFSSTHHLISRCEKSLSAILNILQQNPQASPSTPSHSSASASSSSSSSSSSSLHYAQLDDQNIKSIVANMKTLNDNIPLLHLTFTSSLSSLSEALNLILEPLEMPNLSNDGNSDSNKPKAIASCLCLQIASLWKILTSRNDMQRLMKAMFPIISPEEIITPLSCHIHSFLIDVLDCVTSLNITSTNLETHQNESSVNASSVSNQNVQTQILVKQVTSVLFLLSLSFRQILISSPFSINSQLKASDPKKKSNECNFSFSIQLFYSWLNCLEQLQRTWNLFNFDVSDETQTQKSVLSPMNIFFMFLSPLSEQDVLNVASFVDGSASSASESCSRFLSRLISASKQKNNFESDEALKAESKELKHTLIGNLLCILFLCIDLCNPLQCGKVSSSTELLMDHLNCSWCVQSDHSIYPNRIDWWGIAPFCSTSQSLLSTKTATSSISSSSQTGKQKPNEALLSNNPPLSLQQVLGTSHIVVGRDAPSLIDAQTFIGDEFHLPRTEKAEAPTQLLTYQLIRIRDKIEHEDDLPSADMAVRMPWLIFPLSQPLTDLSDNHLMDDQYEDNPDPMQPLLLHPFSDSIVLWNSFPLPSHHRSSLCKETSYIPLGPTASSVYLLRILALHALSSVVQLIESEKSFNQQKDSNLPFESDMKQKMKYHGKVLEEGKSDEKGEIVEVLSYSSALSLVKYFRQTIFSAFQQYVPTMFQMMMELSASQSNQIPTDANLLLSHSFDTMHRGASEESAYGLDRYFLAKKGTQWTNGIVVCLPSTKEELSALQLKDFIYHSNESPLIHSHNHIGLSFASLCFAVNLSETEWRPFPGLRSFRWKSPLLIETHSLLLLSVLIEKWSEMFRVIIYKENENILQAQAENKFVNKTVKGIREMFQMYSESESEEVLSLPQTPVKHPNHEQLNTKSPEQSNSWSFITSTATDEESDDVPVQLYDIQPAKDNAVLNIQNNSKSSNEHNSLFAEFLTWVSEEVLLRGDDEEMPAHGPCNCVCGCYGWNELWTEMLWKRHAKGTPYCESADFDNSTFGNPDGLIARIVNRLNDPINETQNTFSLFEAVRKTTHPLSSMHGIIPTVDFSEFNAEITSQLSQSSSLCAVHLPSWSDDTMGKVHPSWGYVPIGWRLIYLALTFLVPQTWKEGDGINRANCICNCEESLTPQKPDESIDCPLSSLFDVLAGQATFLISRWLNSSGFQQSSKHQQNLSDCCSLCFDSVVEALRALSQFPLCIIHQISNKQSLRPVGKEAVQPPAQNNQANELLPLEDSIDLDLSLTLDGTQEIALDQAKTEWEEDIDFQSESSPVKQPVINEIKEKQVTFSLLKRFTAPTRTTSALEGNTDHTVPPLLELLPVLLNRLSSPSSNSICMLKPYHWFAAPPKCLMSFTRPVLDLSSTSSMGIWKQTVVSLSSPVLHSCVHLLLHFALDTEIIKDLNTSILRFSLFDPILSLTIDTSKVIHMLCNALKSRNSLENEKNELSSPFMRQFFQMLLTSIAPIFLLSRLLCIIYRVYQNEVPVSSFLSPLLPPSTTTARFFVNATKMFLFVIDNLNNILMELSETDEDDENESSKLQTDDKGSVMDHKTKVNNIVEWQSSITLLLSFCYASLHSLVNTIRQIAPFCGEIIIPYLFSLPSNSRTAENSESSEMKVDDNVLSTPFLPLALSFICNRQSPRPLRLLFAQMLTASASMLPQVSSETQVARKESIRSTNNGMLLNALDDKECALSMVVYDDESENAAERKMSVGEALMRSIITLLPIVIVKNDKIHDSEAVASPSISLSRILVQSKESLSIKHLFQPIPSIPFEVAEEMSSSFSISFSAELNQNSLSKTQRRQTQIEDIQSNEIIESNYLLSESVEPTSLPEPSSVSSQTSETSLKEEEQYSSILSNQAQCQLDEKHNEFGPVAISPNFQRMDNEKEKEATNKSEYSLDTELQITAEDSMLSFSVDPTVPENENSLVLMCLMQMIQISSSAAQVAEDNWLFVGSFVIDKLRQSVNDFNNNAFQYTFIDGYLLFLHSYISVLCGNSRSDAQKSKETGTSGINALFSQQLFNIIDIMMSKLMQDYSYILDIFSGKIVPSQQQMDNLLNISKAQTSVTDSVNGRLRLLIQRNAETKNTQRARSQSEINFNVFPPRGNPQYAFSSANQITPTQSILQAMSLFWNNPIYSLFDPSISLTRMLYPPFSAEQSEDMQTFPSSSQNHNSQSTSSILQKHLSNIGESISLMLEVILLAVQSGILALASFSQSTLFISVYRLMLILTRNLFTSFTAPVDVAEIDLKQKQVELYVPLVKAQTTVLSIFASFLEASQFASDENASDSSSLRPSSSASLQPPISLAARPSVNSFHSALRIRRTALLMMIMMNALQIDNSVLIISRFEKTIPHQSRSGGVEQIQQHFLAPVVLEAREQTLVDLLYLFEESVLHTADEEHARSLMTPSTSPFSVQNEKEEVISTKKPAIGSKPKQQLRLARGRPLSSRGLTTSATKLKDARKDSPSRQSVRSLSLRRETAQAQMKQAQMTPSSRISSRSQSTHTKRQLVKGAPILPSSASQTPTLSQRIRTPTQTPSPPPRPSRQLMLDGPSRDRSPSSSPGRNRVLRPPLRTLSSEVESAPSVFSSPVFSSPRSMASARNVVLAIITPLLSSLARCSRGRDCIISYSDSHNLLEHCLQSASYPLLLLFRNLLFSRTVRERVLSESSLFYMLLLLVRGDGCVSNELFESQALAVASLKKLLWRCESGVALMQRREVRQLWEYLPPSWGILDFIE
ncbi:uncharacterized protein MONOS_11506 [Monocercomonoides exilis]|uniref:uncharacterized protein n=1 Tax=Monocercomonoides exilis TaxID=2049356 RepID=UPI00355A66A5|nr:hypothetical protein MONOS_11506 [Monocercomonoides exilis]|eukprot:MONOS_11506.1-p1 / transcript=MONOS_11506.1 / gene=MONOS_11506 / organism=Monocercomonoides_exilis_PA203 / gene_product=unspecified product / transcript_product=unspecified product / location=Mono_scaffold00581:21585-32987(+) / protein_length=3801 / sequence_SO=supercontig / SO=protein_coding / is_pseudo=false